MTAWKAQIRRKIWEAMEAAAGGTFSPMPFYGRTPSFRGDAFAVNRLTSTAEFASARVVKVERSLRDAAFRTLLLDLGKSVALTRVDLQDAFYSVLEKTDFPFHYRTCDAAQRETADALARCVPLRQPVPLDIVVLPSVAVDPSTGARVGLGNGAKNFGSDLECGIFAQIGAISAETKFVTMVHPLQLCSFDRAPLEKFDVPVDIVLTPWKVYYTETALPRPTGIYWDLVSEEHLKEVAALATLRAEAAMET